MTQALQPHTPTIIQIVKDDPAPQLSMIDVAVAAFGLTGVIMAAALVAGLLAGGLTRRAKREDAQGWVAGVIRKTWWPFATVLAVAIAFAWYAAAHFPAARTFKEAVAMALSA